MFVEPPSERHIGHAKMGYTQIVQWALQTYSYFYMVRGLSNKGLNPYNDTKKFPYEYQWFDRLFDQKRVFKITNP